MPREGWAKRQAEQSKKLMDEINSCPCSGCEILRADMLLWETSYKNARKEWESYDYPG